MDKRLAAELLKARTAVKNKYDTLKSDIAAAQLDVQQKFKPISEPLKELVTQLKTENLLIKEEPFHLTTPKTPQRGPKPLFSSTPIGFPITPKRSQVSQQPTILQPPVDYVDTQVVAEAGFDEDDGEAVDVSLTTLKRELEAAGTTAEFENFLKQFQGLAKIFVEGIFRDTNNEYEHHYGVRFNPVNSKFEVGDSELNFAEQDLVITRPSGETFTYVGTPGLYELLFKKHPVGDFTEKDQKQYVDLLRRTNAIRRHYNADSPLLGTGKKYSQIIKPLLMKQPGLEGRRPRTLSSAKKTGSGVAVLKLNNKKVEFVPWKDPNVLVNRLRTLLSSKSAGHTGHNNEIVYIIEELREAKIIK